MAGWLFDSFQGLFCRRNGYAVGVRPGALAVKAPGPLAADPPLRELPAFGVVGLASRVPLSFPAIEPADHRLLIPQLLHPLQTPHRLYRPLGLGERHPEAHRVQSPFHRLGGRTRVVGDFRGILPCVY